ncbi:hydroxyacylglutathione hydrolase [Rheinheimera baltica]|uniref:hydroxyacylglutathione hydrolase n=2 Tax=Rheinheimera baltica TaxID=67576 RepID=UPI00040E0669|nr:hydroxyacylglutathione hydrolase [Rheinheimera baltica]MDP5141318.1 hydroxyacylglutathione hydrolase [Rheinheimera baltica]MDP5148547.1 hydroxyacylglutathione hydrolase [Rheinheimera baltica]
MTAMLEITPIQAFEDNYIWALCQPTTAKCLIVDPGCANSVLQYLSERQLVLDTILVTHHHADHTAGINILRQHFPGIQVIGPAAEQYRIAGLTQSVTEGDTIALPQFNLELSVISLPGHTLGHIAFYSAPVLFCGDTLFSAGCGRLFEGSPEQMWQSLQKLMALPDETQIYCTHEYTLANLKFALHAEPSNSDLIEYTRHCTHLREKNLPTLPSKMQLEKAINPFLRCKNKSLQKKWQQDSAQTLFTALRAAKDQFKG